MSFTSSSETFTARWSDVYIAAGCRAIDNGGDMLAAVALALILQQRGFGGIAIASLMLAAAIPPILLSAVAGRVADRLDSRLILTVIGLVQVAVCAALAFTTSVYAIVGLVAVLAIGVSFTSPTFSALTPAMVGRDNMAKASGLLQTSGMVGSLLGPVVGGLLVGHFGARVPLLVDAATYLAIPAAGFLLRTRRRGGIANSEQALPVQIDAPAWSIWRDPLIRPFMFLLAAVIAALTAVNVVDVFYVRETLHASSSFYGLLSAFWMIGMAIGTAIVARMKPDDARSARLMLMLLGGTGLTVVVVGLVPQAIWMLPLEIIGGMTNGGENVIAGALLGRRAPAAQRGHAFSMFGGLMNGAVTVGLAAGGLLLTFASPRAVVIGAGVAGLVVLVPFAGPVLRAAARERASAPIGLDESASEPQAPVGLEVGSPASTESRAPSIPTVDDVESMV
jgi:MFS family permease